MNLYPEEAFVEKLEDGEISYVVIDFSFEGPEYESF